MKISWKILNDNKNVIDELQNWFTNSKADHIQQFLKKSKNQL